MFNVSSLAGGFHNSTGETSLDSLALFEPVLWPRTMAIIFSSPPPTVSRSAAAVARTDTGLRLPVPLISRESLLDKPVDRRYTVVYNLTAWGVEKREPHRVLPPAYGAFINGGIFSINGKTYTGRIEYCMVLGLVEEWTVVNAANPFGRWMHSFHIHQNSFQIVGRSMGEAGQVAVEELVPGDWRDTVQIPARGNVTFRIQSKDFTGKFPFHCHVTAHQGVGMMQLVEVFADPAQCPQ